MDEVQGLSTFSIVEEDDLITEEMRMEDVCNKKNAFCADSYMLTHICFGVNFTFLLIHLVTLICFKKARRFYGVGYFLGQIFLSISSLLTLVCCSLDNESKAFEYLLLIANFGYLVNLSAQTLTAILTSLFAASTPVVFDRSNSAQMEDSPLRISAANNTTNPNVGIQVGCLRKTWVNVVALMCIFGVPLSMTIKQSLSVSVNSTHLRPTSEHQRVACSFIPNKNTLYFLLTPAVILLGVQLIIICVALQRCSPTPDMLGKGVKRYQRLMALLKICIGQLLVWGTALVALTTSSNTLWNIFTICTPLQSIFAATVCILSRSVVGAALASKYQSNGGRSSSINYHFAPGHHSISDDDREMLHACQYKLADENERFYY